MSVISQAMGAMPKFCGDDELRSVIQALGPEEALGNFRLAELKAICKRFHLKSSGDKHQLIGSIARHILAASSGSNIASSKGQKRTWEVPGANGEAAKRSRIDLERHLQGIVQALGPEEALGNLTVPELREHCKCFGLRTTGDKRNIISRIATHVLALSLEAGLQTDSTSAPTQEDQRLPSPALGNSTGVAASRPVATDKTTAAAEAFTSKAPLGSAFAAVDRDSVPGLFARSEPETNARAQHVMDAEPETPMKTAAPKGETTQLFNYQNLAQKVATAEADVTADRTSSKGCGQIETAMTAAWTEEVVCQDDPANLVEHPNPCVEAESIPSVDQENLRPAEFETPKISAARTDSIGVDAGTGGDNFSMSPCRKPATHENQAQSDRCDLAGPPTVPEGTTDIAIDLERLRSAKSGVAMILAAPSVPMEVDEGTRKSIDATPPFAMQTVQEHRVHSAGADPVDHTHVCERAGETFVGDSRKKCSAESGAAALAAPAFRIQAATLAAQPHVCEEAAGTVAVELDRPCSAESQAAAMFVAPTVPMDVDGGTVGRILITPPHGMQQTLNEHQEHSCSAETLLEEEGEVYDKQEEQEREREYRHDELTKSDADCTDQTSWIACGQEDATQITVQTLVADHTTNHAAGDQGDDAKPAGSPGVCEEVSETFAVQSEQEPFGDSHGASIPSVSTAFMEAHGERGEKGELVCFDNTNQDHPESAETQVEDDEDERREDRQVEQKQQEERLDKQREDAEDESWEEGVEKAKKEEEQWIERQSERQKERHDGMQEPGVRDEEPSESKYKLHQIEEAGEDEEEDEQQDRLPSLVCSRHGARGGWTIHEYCSECDAIATQLASEGGP